MQRCETTSHWLMEGPGVLAVECRLGQGRDGGRRLIFKL